MQMFGVKSGLIIVALALSPEIMALQSQTTTDSADAATTGPALHTDTHIKTPAKQYADFQHVLFTYLQNDFVMTLALIDKARAVHGFSDLSPDDNDRLSLMQGASQLYLGLYQQAQQIFVGLLERATSQYVQAQTWYWLAKAGFESGQQALSEQAYQAIITAELEDELSFEQWQELTYFAAHSRMLAQSNWQALLNELDDSTIFPAYLQANYAVKLFNQGDFAQAQGQFVNAKQALITHRDAQRGILDVASDLTGDFLYLLSPWNWFGDDPNRLSQQRQEEAAEQALQREQDALFDQVNLFLGYTLLQQQDDKNAMAVLQQVATDDIEAKQAILTLGWAYAQQNEWPSAMAIWQYLADNDPGHFQLQASYAMAYSYQQQGRFEQAYYALDSTVSQIEHSLTTLKDFRTTVNQPDFLDQFATQWPDELLDIKRRFLTTTFDDSHLDTTYYLSVRTQAREILTSLNAKQQQLAVLDSMLTERQQRFNARSEAISLDAARQQLADAEASISAIRQRLNVDSDDDAMALMIDMLPQKSLQKWSRLQGAKQRHARLLNDPPRGKPLNPEYAERLQRIEGILQWQMNDALIQTRWQHKRLLDHAEAAYEQARTSLASVAEAQQASPQLMRDKQRIEQLSLATQTHSAQASTVFAKTSQKLNDLLNQLVDERSAELEKQWVNARLARIRLQDMQPELTAPTAAIQSQRDSELVAGGLR